MKTKDKKKWIRWIASVCIFAASVSIYVLGINHNFVVNYDDGIMHRYIFIGMSLMYFAMVLVFIGRINGYIKPIRWKSKVWNRIWNILFFFLVAFAATLTEELLWNDTIYTLKMWVFGVNCALIMVITFALVMWIPKTWVAYVLIMVLNLIYGLVNHYVLVFNGCPPMYNDFFAAKTAATVMGSYTYVVDKRIIYGVFLFLLVITLILVIPPTDIRIKTKKQKGQIAVWASRVAIPVALLIGVYNMDFKQLFGMDIYAWKPIFSFHDNGAPMTMLISFQYSKPEKPEGYSKVAAERILSSFEPEETETTAMDQKPIIIAIMNESFSDLSVLGDFESDPYLSNWYAEDSYVMRGYVYSSVYGGGTCNSEFEFLTGNSVVNCSASTYPYESYDLTDTANMAGYLRDTQGYDTVAFHPYGPENWNRPVVYDNFGFNTYLCWDDMEDPQYVSWAISDKSDYEKVEEILDEREAADQPLFLFNVTMQNHGGYALDDLAEDTAPISIESTYSGYEDVVMYLTLMRESDREFASLLTDLEQREEPIIVCLFGDHQPSLNGEFLNTVTVQQDSENEVAQDKKFQMTPYMIWANYDTGIEQTEKDMSINYLGADLMNVAGYHTSYSDYLLSLQREIPIVNAHGYQTADGQWHSAEETNVLLDDYKVVQYYEIFEKNK